MMSFGSPTGVAMWWRCALLAAAGATAAACATGGDDAEPGAAGTTTADPGGLGGGFGDGQGSGETCGNGLDDDENGSIDDGCTCEPGATQPCFLGSPDQAGEDACTTGVQTCIVEGSVEFTSGNWGECAVSGGASEEGCGCATVTCEGLCCATAASCCPNGLCPDEKGTCGTGCSKPDTRTMIVLDRSNSMAKRPDGSTIGGLANQGQARWNHAVDAVDHLVKSGGPLGIEFGLIKFPRLSPVPMDPVAKVGCQTVAQIIDKGAYESNDPDHCTETKIAFLPGGNNQNIVESVDYGDKLCNSTPMQDALEAVPLGQAKYVILLTDGIPTCDQDPVAAVASLASAGVHTFVVGFGADVKGAVSLNKAACAGLEAREPATHCSGASYLGGTGDAFYYANDGAALDQMLQDIVQTICN